MKNTMMWVLGIALIGGWALSKRKPITFASIDLLTGNSTSGNPVTHDDVVAILELNPGWSAPPGSDAWNALFPNGLPDNLLGDGDPTDFLHT